MRLSRYFIPVLKENPAEAQIVSHRLMLRAGLIKQATAGIYSWLPLGFKVLRRLENIIHEEQQRAGHQAIQCQYFNQLNYGGKVAVMMIMVKRCSE